MLSPMVRSSGFLNRENLDITFYANFIGHDSYYGTYNQYQNTGGYALARIIFRLSGWTLCTTHKTRKIGESWTELCLLAEKTEAGKFLIYKRRCVIDTKGGFCPFAIGTSSCSNQKAYWHKSRHC